jgi:hypothetical protein
VNEIAPALLMSDMAAAYLGGTDALGEALVRTLRSEARERGGLDRRSLRDRLASARR